MTEIDARTVYAAERTLLAWIRTGLAMMGFGFVVARFSLLFKELIQVNKPGATATPGFSLWIGAILVTLGVAVNVMAGIQHAKEVQRIHKGIPLKEHVWPMSRIISLLLAIIGIVMVAYLILLGFEPRVQP